MTLRGRLTAAFLAVVLGPVLLGAMFVGGTVAAVGRDRAADRLGVAATAVRSSVSSLCQQLQAAADAVAVTTDPVRQTDVASQVVARGLASGVVVERADGVPTLRTPGSPERPWADCAQPTAEPGPFVGLAVRIEARDAAGAPLGSVWATHDLDATTVGRLAGATGTAVTLLGGSPPVAVHSTESPGTLPAVLAAAAGMSGDALGETTDGRVVRRVAPAPGQPLPLVLSVPTGQLQGLYALLVCAVVLAALFAVCAAWWLARSTTRPLAELAGAADRAAGGDLAARVPVRGQDEVGRLSVAFNRMTRETQAYVRALTTSRDQLRGHLAVLGDTLSSTHDLPRILEVILETARAATGASGGVVLLLDAATGTLVGQCGLGVEAAGRVPLGAGLLGGVAATGVPRRGRVERDGPPLSPFEPACRTYVAVPFNVAGPPTEPVPGVQPLEPPTASGVLALYDRLGNDEFDDADVITLRTFAGQAAVAVDNVRVHQEAQRLSLTDPLTGLWNYRYLRESIRREVERASRFGRMLAVLALDLDRFKEVNDTHGHAAGDAVLVEFARRIRGVVREVDLAFRQGGEEFVVLLPETDAEGAAIVARRLGSAVRDETFDLDDADGIAVTVSIGIAVFPSHAATAQAVLDAADDALYAAKAAGRDGFRVAPGGEPVMAEIPVAAAAVTPADNQPRAGGSGLDLRRPAEQSQAGGSKPIRPAGGASSGTQPPRQTRGG
ncbi:diguanylate cyclase [Asanoa sp. NPDC050611]|uniref:GGDEF domain-containing protein n=1 Tax=Asanoa sp. NPDC050611 TaxID=3157098 RepID=UPI0033EC93A6